MKQALLIMTMLLALHVAHATVPPDENIFLQISNGNSVGVKTIVLKNKAVLSQKNMKNLSALTFAIVSNKYEIAQWLAERMTKEQINEDNGKKYTALAAMADAGPYSGESDYRNLLDTLIEKGANIETGASYATILSYAAYKNNITMVEKLISSGANIHVVDPYNATPLHYAAVALCSECVSALLEAGADPKIKKKDGNTAFDLALKSQPQSLIGTASDKEKILEILDPEVVMKKTLAKKQAEENETSQKQSLIASESARKQAIAAQHAPNNETVAGYQVTLSKNEFMSRYKIATTDCEEKLIDSEHFQAQILTCSPKNPDGSEVFTVYFYKNKIYKFLYYIPGSENVWLRTLAKQLEAKSGKKGELKTYGGSDGMAEKYCAFEVPFLDGVLVAMAKKGFYISSLANYSQGKGAAITTCHDGIFEHDRAGVVRFEVSDIHEQMNKDYWDEIKKKEAKEKQSDIKI